MLWFIAIIHIFNGACFNNETEKKENWLHFLVIYLLQVINAFDIIVSWKLI